MFIMEPCLNPALEAQAIGRVHRLGQKRPVEVTRLIVKDSVESRIVQMIEKKYGRANPGEGTVSTQDTSNAAESLKTDKAKVFAEEFDILFGVEPRQVPSAALSLVHSSPAARTEPPPVNVAPEAAPSAPDVIRSL